MSNKTPPILSKSKTYVDWIKKVNIWCRITSLPKKDQAGAILMTLEGEAEDAVLELTEDEIVSEDGVKLVKERLDKIYKKNETLEKFEALDKFETYSRPLEVSIHDFIIEFDKRYSRTKKLGTAISDDLLAYRMIKSANLSEQDEKVVKATTSLKYDEVKDKLKSIFGDAGCSTSSNIKKEDVFQSEDFSDEYNSETTLYTRGKFSSRGTRGRGYQGQANRGRVQFSKRGKSIQKS